MPKHVFYKSWYRYTTELDENRKKRTLVVLSAGKLNKNGLIL